MLGNAWDNYDNCFLYLWKLSFQNLPKRLGKRGALNIYPNQRIIKRIIELLQLAVGINTIKKIIPKRTNKEIKHLKSVKQSHEYHISDRAWQGNMKLEKQQQAPELPIALVQLGTVHATRLDLPARSLIHNNLVGNAFEEHYTTMLTRRQVRSSND